MENVPRLDLGQSLVGDSINVQNTLTSLPKVSEFSPKTSQFSASRASPPLKIDEISLDSSIEFNDYNIYTQGIPKPESDDPIPTPKTPQLPKNEPIKTKKKFKPTYYSIRKDKEFSRENGIKTPGKNYEGLRGLRVKKETQSQPLIALRPIKKNYYQEVSKSKFMQKFEEKKLLAKDLGQSHERNTDVPVKASTVIATQTENFEDEKNNNLFDSVEYESNHYEYNHTLPSKLTEYENIRNTSPVNSYLSNYKYSNSTRPRDMSVMSAPPKLKKSQTRERLMNRQLGPTNNTIFNEIFENKETKIERSYLRKKQLEYAKRLRYLNETNQTKHRPTKGVLEKLKENVDKAVGDRTTTAEKRLQGLERRDRLLNYAKNNIPKPNVKESGFQPKSRRNFENLKKYIVVRCR